MQCAVECSASCEVAVVSVQCAVCRSIVQVGSSSVKFVRIHPQSRGLLARVGLGILARAGRLGAGAGRTGRAGSKRAWI